MLLFPALAHADADCTPSRLLIVLDKSSSMNDTIGADSKWSIAKQAITQVANTYENKIDLGLNIFPNPNQCAPGKTVVTPGPANASAIVAAFGADPPSGGNYTPMAQSIDAAAADAALADPSRRPTILLVTDGWQWCSPYDPSTRSLPVGAVQRAKANGITVYVVGFGDDVDSDTLNQMALEGGTALAGCDPSDASKKCYFQADSAADLLAALQTVSINISTEICDGKDNDCDGIVDNITRDCSTPCGSGSETCTMGAWGSCTAPTPSPEVCDGNDNDCDGVVDNITRECSTACGSGSETCTLGSWVSCTAPMTSPEICNGVDDDCDGQIDNGADLCPGGACVDGACQLPSAAVPSQPHGCGCKIGGVSDMRGGFLMILLLAALLLARRRQMR
jgi:MYXO-CTERM domain-containing protein